jgi:pSer/pThr/pTyr-binding forkhead associated (FHA) protein
MARSGKDADPSSSPPVLRLRVIDEGRERHVVLDSDAHLVGSDPGCEVVLRDPSVSRRHATIFVGTDG